MVGRVSPVERVIRVTDDDDLPLIGRVTGYAPDDPDVLYVAWGDADDEAAVREFIDELASWRG
jgi:hypothetical protein